MSGGCGGPGQAGFFFDRAVADPGGGGGGDRGDHPPPPPWTCPNTESLCKVCRDQSPPPPWNVDDITRAMSKGGGGVLVNVQEWGCFSIFRRADDVTRTMSKGGCLWMSSPPPPSGNPVSAPVGGMPVGGGHELCCLGARPGSRRQIRPTHWPCIQASSYTHS